MSSVAAMPRGRHNLKPDLMQALTMTSLTGTVSGIDLKLAFSLTAYAFNSAIQARGALPHVLMYIR